MSLRSRMVKAATLVAVGALALTGCDFDVYSVPLPGGADLGDDPYEVTVEFRDVLDLVPQSAVKVDDVTVGRVDDITLDGYTAQVTVLLRDDVKLPDNAEAQIRQTSLLGEKFVSLAAPVSGASQGRLADGDRIPLERSGRNPEVEEVLGAMSLLLNGGGVAQLKTISTELNKALEGRESNVKGVLDQIDTFMGQIDDNKASIVEAIESLNRLSKSLNEQEGTIKSALDNLPQALASIDSQRDDLVKMLKALTELSSVGTRVIRDSKAATIQSLESLAPTLNKLAEAGDALPKSLQVFLTYPFVDAVVGKNPAQARNLHMGDYTNLAIQLDLDFSGQNQPTLPEPPDVCAETPLDPVCDALPNPPETISDVQKCLESGDITSDACRRVLKDINLYERLKNQCAKPENADNPVCKVVNPLPPLPANPDPSDLPPLPTLPTPSMALPTIPGILGRAPYGGGGGSGGADGVSTDKRYDSDLAPLLVWGMVDR
ncbi:MCE family protein [Nocardioides iriomotensis]|uniref:MCE family protein n=1 Tax=Nocardioides iriomotensis TaxID=715784 RepID=A0A4Q5JCI1_9ACTN|nr:MCE family protein [Nocardioides iriomotensis]RYU15781.1 MCE family protein [Nocardioides iriomotensis]